MYKPGQLITIDKNVYRVINAEKLRMLEPRYRCYTICGLCRTLHREERKKVITSECDVCLDYRRMSDNYCFKPVVKRSFPSLP